MSRKHYDEADFRQCDYASPPILTSCPGIELSVYDTYMIRGDQMAGGAENRNRDFLLLQIAAKVTELCVVASLATAIMGIVRAQVMSAHGIPLGLLSSPFRFNEIAYFWSPSFLFGTMSIQGRPRAVAIALLLLSCGFLAAVVGPSTALLIIPYTDNNWPAGGTDFWLVGSDDTLWPDRLNSSHAGGDFCLHANDTQ
ncbi:hypothetical protein DHEL01_v209763, partial [Diaporthe helianthi]